MYIALLMINGKFYSEIAEKSLQVQNKNSPNASAGNVSNAVQSIAATVYTTIFYINCGVFASLLRSVPMVGVLLSFAMNCLIVSYYCFEYRWVYMGWSLEQRIAYIEQHWSFFLGFGLPATFLTFFLSTLRGGALFPLIYPSYVIMAFMATPKSASPSGQPVASSVSSSSEFMLPNKIPAFFVVRKLNSLVIGLVRLVGGVRVESMMADKKDVAVKKDQ
ncbi:etoposide-induced protein 2.4-domain-containing protein [Chlamydoabsidia padenii]|nr:etoposide-induced protein 2.4-domain-containing protein [Chlamydoabsidia padenii]